VVQQKNEEKHRLEIMAAWNGFDLTEKNGRYWLIDTHHKPVLGKETGVSAMEIEEFLKAQRPA
jgi:hypothetical protein